MKILTILVIATKNSNSKKSRFPWKKFPKEIMEDDIYTRWEDSSSFAISYRKLNKFVSLFFLSFEILLSSNFHKEREKIKSPAFPEVVFHEEYRWLPPIVLDFDVFPFFYLHVLQHLLHFPTAARYLSCTNSKWVKQRPKLQTHEPSTIRFILNLLIIEMQVGLFHIF